LVLMKGSSKKRILIVEDNPTYRKMLKMRLESSGYEVLTAQDGLEGLSAARKEKPDLIVLDLMLPGMSGHQVCRLLKYDRNFRHIPVVVLTSRDLEEDAELVKKSRGDAFMAKTTRAAIILDVIERLLERGAASG